MARKRKPVYRYWVDRPKDLAPELSVVTLDYQEDVIIPRKEYADLLRSKAWELTRQADDQDKLAADTSPSGLNPVAPKKRRRKAKRKASKK